MGAFVRQRCSARDAREIPRGAGRVVGDCDRASVERRTLQQQSEGRDREAKVPVADPHRRAHVTFEEEHAGGGDGIRIDDRRGNTLAS